jgi:hypothetical protein
MSNSNTRCTECSNRRWQTVAGFLVLGCKRRDVRFGIAPDLNRGYVNKAGGCVAMPQLCKEYVQ